MAKNTRRTHQNQLPMFFRILPFFAFFMMVSATLPEADLRVMTSVMTYNIHIENCNEQPRPWDERKSMVAQVIHSRAPEIIGLQGASLGQTDWLNSALKEYEYYAPTAQNLEMGTDICPILYARNVYESLDQGTILIGEAIAKVDSKRHDHPSRYLNWVKLRHIESQKILFVLNTKISVNAKSDKQKVADRIQESINVLVGEDTFIFLADLAQSPQSEIINEISKWANDSESNSLVSISDQEATHPGWKKIRKHTGKRVDYIFLSMDIPANSYEVLDVAYDGEYPSDHLPVYCRIRIQ